MQSVVDTLLLTLGKIGFDWQVAVANLVNFIIIVFLLQRFAWKPLRRTLEKRADIIEKGIKKSEEAEKLLQNAETHSAVIIREAKEQASAIVADATSTGTTLKEKMLSEAKGKSHAILSRAELESERIKADALREAEGDIQSLVTQLASQALKDLPDSVHGDIIKARLS